MIKYYFIENIVWLKICYIEVIITELKLGIRIGNNIMSSWFPFPSQETVEKDFQTSFVKLDNMLHDYYVKNKENEAFVNQVSYIL